MNAPELKLFPWINRGEFRRVYRELYSDKVALQKHALGRVSVWKARMDNLPVAVDLTAELVKCSISNEEITDRGVVAQSLGFMIMKFVNNITEERQRTVKRKSVSELAAEIGIDKSIVNLRHDVAHNVMPSIHVLQAALRYSLNWLKTNFWEIQMQEPDLAPSRANQKLSLLQDLLDQYKQEMFGEQSGKRNGMSHELKKQIEQSLRHLGHKSFPVLVDTGYFIFTLEQLNHLDLTHKDILTEPYGLPDELVTVWKPVITILEKFGLMPGLLLYMTYVLTQDSSYTNRMLYGWIYMLLTTYGSWNNLLPYQQLLDSVVQIVNEYAPPVLLKLIELVDEKYLTTDKKDVLRAELERLYASINTEETSPECTDQTDISEEEIQVEERKVWTKCMKHIHWSSQPFGLLPNQSITYKNLELDWSRFDDEQGSGEQDSDNEVEDHEGNVSEMEMTDVHIGPTDQIQKHHWNEQTVEYILQNVSLL